MQILRLKNLPPSLTVGGYGLGVVAIGKALLWASYANLHLGVQLGNGHYRYYGRYLGALSPGPLA